MVNNMKTKQKISQKSRERERERECSYASKLFSQVCHSLAKQPDWAMKSWAALNIDELILLDMFGSPCWRVVIFSRFTVNLNMVFRCTCVKCGQCRM